jgi:hypothetical protein
MSLHEIQGIHTVLGRGHQEVPSPKETAPVTFDDQTKFSQQIFYNVRIEIYLNDLKA